MCLFSTITSFSKVLHIELWNVVAWVEWVNGQFFTNAYEIKIFS